MCKKERMTDYRRHGTEAMGTGYTRPELTADGDVRGMWKEKATGPKDTTVSRIIQVLPTDVLYVMTDCNAPSSRGVALCSWCF